LLMNAHITDLCEKFGPAIIAAVVSYLLSIVTMHHQIKRDPLGNPPNGRPLIRYYNIQSASDINEHTKLLSAKPLYMCGIKEQIDNDTGEKRSSVILSPCDIGKLDQAQSYALFSIENDSKVGISIDELYYENGIRVSLNNSSKLFIEKERKLMLVFTMDMKPNQIKIDYANEFLIFSVTNRPQMLRIERSKCKK
jgi:hypothetical protein